MTLLDYKTKLPGYFPSAWPVECGGPRRQKLTRSPGLNLAQDERLRSTTRDMGGWSVMLVHREPGELFVQGGAQFPPNQFPPHYLPDGRNQGWLERIDPISLETLARSPELPSGGHLWCGAVVVHANGDLYMVNGNYCHRLNADCEVLAERQLPVDGPYNGLLIMSDGNLVMKNLGFQRGEPCRFSVVEPERLELIGDPFVIDTPCMGRFSSDRTDAGEFIYTSSASEVFRLRYERGALTLDTDWQANYAIEGEDQADGWDSAVGSESIWLMDAGRPPFWEAGRATAPQRAFRFDASGSGERDVIDVIGRSAAFSPGPPLYDPERRILVVYDGRNGGIAALRYNEPGSFEILWQNDFKNNVQMMLYPDTGELIVEDMTPSPLDSAEASSSNAVIVEIETGRERGRAPIGALTTSGMFLCPGFERDFYVATLPGAIARVFAE